MSALVVTCQALPSWSATLTLEGTLFQVQMDFNQRAFSWYLSIADADGVDIYNGVKVVCGFLLLGKCKDDRRPAGDFLCISSTTNYSPPGFVDLLPGSGRCSLVYITSDWLAAIKAGQLAALQAQVAAGATGTSTISTYGQD
jgi:hypothetical protein